LPSHAGKEAALYDGSGAQILGRTAVRHWLDPHPDAAAFAETWEFSTKGTMTQAALEAAGWTFTNVSAEVSKGVLWLTATSANWGHASLAVNLAGDFDILCTPVFPDSYGFTPRVPYAVGGIGVADTVNNVVQHAYIWSVNGLARSYNYFGGTWSAGGGSGTSATLTPSGLPPVIRIRRVSGSVKTSIGSSWPMMGLVVDDTNVDYRGFVGEQSVADADTYQKLFLANYFQGGDNGAKFGFIFLRRFQ
jgi:hypothetical protein